MKFVRMIAYMAVLGIAGCGKEETSPVPAVPLPGAAGTPIPTAQPLTTAELDAIAPASKPYRLALIVKTRNNPFFDPMIKAAEAEAKALGCTLEVQSPAQETDKERQFALVQDVVAKGCDALLVTPADSKGIVPALKQAADKKTLIINLDNRVDGETATSAGLKLSGYAGANNEEGGKLAGKALIAALPKDSEVAILEGIRGVDNAEARRRGFESAVEGILKVVAKESAEWETPKAYAKFAPILAAHPNLKAVFCANDKMALGALQAIEEAGKSGKVSVVGYDNIADVKSALSKGAMLATIEQHPDLMGKYGVRIAVGILEGRLDKGREYQVSLEVIKGMATPK